MIGSDRHKRCREIQARLEERDRRIDVLLWIFKDDIDKYMMKEWTAGNR